MMNQPRLSHQPGDYLDPGREHYRIVERLNQGGMGTVYKVIKEPTNTEYAVKECDLLDDPRRRGMPRAEAVRIFISEASSIEQLKIEGIPQGFLMVEPQDEFAVCLSCGNPVEQAPCIVCKPTPDSFYANPQVVANRYYLVMDFIAGKDADEAVLDWPRPLQGQKIREIAVWLADIANILAELHARHLVHRDIKPGNIRIREVDGRRFLLDFGLLRLETAAGKTRVLQPKTTYNLGTEGFAAPEQVKGNPSPASDIYALGMTAISLFTGLDPGNPLERKKIEDTDIETLLPALTDEAQHVLHRSLSPDPSPRPDALEWASVFSGDVIGTKKSPKQVRSKKPGVSSKRMTFSIPTVVKNKKVLAIVAVAFLAVWWFGIRNPIDPDAIRVEALDNALLYSAPDENTFLQRLSGGETLLVKDHDESSETYWYRVYTIDGKRTKAFVLRNHILRRRGGVRP